MTMETRQTAGTRELAGDTERDDEPRGRFQRDGEPRTAEAGERAARERDAGAGERAARERDADTPRSTSEFAATSSSSGDGATELLSRDDNSGFQSRWETIQTGFVDEPRRTVEQADELVAEVMKRLAEGFAAERERLEQQWGRGEDVSTEDLRLALQRYRSFFQRLLDV
jgi:hypothetical protein